MSKIDVSKKVVIFPKATAFLQNHGYSVTVSGRRQCDIQLLNFLVEKEMKQEDLPDVSIYDPKTREWVDLVVDTEDTLSFAAGRNGCYVYYPMLLDSGRLDLLIGFINVYSGNTLVIERKDTKQQAVI